MQVSITRRWDHEKVSESKVQVEAKAWMLTMAATLRGFNGLSYSPSITVLLQLLLVQFSLHYLSYSPPTIACPFLNKKPFNLVTLMILRAPEMQVYRERGGRNWKNGAAQQIFLHRCHLKRFPAMKINVKPMTRFWSSNITVVLKHLITTSCVTIARSISRNPDIGIAKHHRHHCLGEKIW